MSDLQLILKTKVNGKILVYPIGIGQESELQSRQLRGDSSSVRNDRNASDQLDP